MTVTDIATNMGGRVSYRKWTITWQDLIGLSTASGTAAQLKLIEVGMPGPSGSPTTFVFPQASKVLGVCVHATTAFSGGSISALTVSLGISGGTTTFFTAAFDIYQAVADTTLQETALFKMGQITALTPAVNLAPTSDSLSHLIAGSFDLYILFCNVTSPSE